MYLPISSPERSTDINSPRSLLVEAFFGACPWRTIPLGGGSVYFDRSMQKPLLPQPVGRQLEVLYLKVQPRTIVLGTAGSGKTTLAMLRAKFLSDRTVPHGGKTLLLSFNNTLVRYFESFADLAGQNIDCRTYHRFARGYLDVRGRMSPGAICSPERREQLIQRCVNEAQTRGESGVVTAKPLLFLSDELRWIAQHGIRSLEGYATAKRSGRNGTRLVRAERAAVYRLYERYRDVRQEVGLSYDWDDLAISVHDEFLRDGSARMYRHIVIDEGQDFSPMMLKSLAAAVPNGGSLTFFGDMAQQIYGNRISWRDAGFGVQHPWLFEQNYRNTPQIAALALAIASMPYFTAVTDLVAPKMTRAAGAMPALVECKSAAAEVQFVAATALNRARTESVAVLFQDRSEENVWKTQLGNGATRLHKELDAWRPGPGVFYGTYAAAKGLEFDSVLLPRLSDKHMPDAEHVSAFGQADADSAGGKHLYVAVTRAKSTLILTYCGQVTHLLPTQRGLLMKATA